MRDFLREIVAEQQEEWRRNPPPPPPPPSPPPPPPPPGAAAAPAAVSITNNQIQGVDEGDIVKLRGETLVILRRGRLFTVSIAGGAMRPIMGIDAFPPGVDGRGDWYDEMLIAGDMVAVIGFSYSRGGTQLNRFRLDADGRLSFVDAHQLRSGDYYSSRNYASRLLGNQLVLYAPLYLRFQGDPLNSLPALRRWDPAAPNGGAFRRIANGTNVYVPQRMRNWRQANITTLHSVTRCDLSAAVLDCDATVVMGSPSRTFFVSNNAVYLWAANVWKNRAARRQFDHLPPAVRRLAARRGDGARQSRSINSPSFPTRRAARCRSSCALMAGAMRCGRRKRPTARSHCSACR